MKNKSIELYLRIENTRIIFDLLQEIWREKWNGDVFRTEKDCRKDVERLVDGIKSKDFEFCHNPISRFIEFWDVYFKYDWIRQPDLNSIKDEKTKDGVGIETLTTLYQYYFKIKYLFDGKRFDFDQAPYIYEDICVLMCRLMKYNMCYLICHQENERPIIISQSGYYEPYFIEKNEEEKILDVSDIEPYIEYSYGSENNGECQTSIDGIYCFNKPLGKQKQKSKEDKNDGAKPEILLLKLRANDSRERLGERSFFVLFQGIEETEKISKKNNKLFYDLPKILLMREKLSAILYRDCDRLVGMKNNYGYILPIKRMAQNQDDFLRVFHISDLHINGKVEPEDFAKKIINEQNEEQEVDLLAITGDVVSGQGEARVLQKNYQNAEKVLKQIASKLWNGKPYDNRIPHDWKKRILITTGNHDYASMNELQVNLEGRKTRYLGPSGEKGGTMVKFAYFIEFLQRFLDLPMNQLISNDLNEVRYYEKLNLKVFLLNSTSKANPYQTNKVGINKEILTKLKKEIKTTGSNTVHLCLTHHAGNYDINYLSDVYEFYKYDVLKLTSLKSFKKLAETMVEFIPENAVCRALTSLNGKKFKFDFKKEIVNGGYKKSEPKSIDVKQLLKWEEAKNKFFRSIIYSDMQQIYNWQPTENEGIGETDDYIIQIVNRCRDLIYTARNDKKVYQNALDLIGCDIILSGHEHRTIVEKKSHSKAINITIGPAEYSQNIFIYDKNNHIAKFKIYYRGEKKDDEQQITIDFPSKEIVQWKTEEVVYNNI